MKNGNFKSRALFWSTLIFFGAFFVQFILIEILQLFNYCDIIRNFFLISILLEKTFSLNYHREQLAKI